MYGIATHFTSESKILRLLTANEVVSFWSEVIAPPAQQLGSQSLRPVIFLSTLARRMDTA